VNVRIGKHSYNRYRLGWKTRKSNEMDPRKNKKVKTNQICTDEEILGGLTSNEPGAALTACVRFKVKQKAWEMRRKAT